jgi:hypothetical protein
MSEYFKVQGKEWEAYLPAFDYILIDLSPHSQHQIHPRLFSEIQVQTSLMIEKYIFNKKQLMSYLKKSFKINILYYESVEGQRFLRIVALYIFSATSVCVQEVVEQVQPEEGQVKEVLMTTAEKLRKEGMEIGLEEGLIKGMEEGTLRKQQEVLIKLVNKKFGITEQESDRIRNYADTQKLDLALETILFADTKETVLRILT